MSGTARSVDPCFAATLRAASRRVTMLYDEALAPFGLRVTQYHVLSEIERRTSDPPTIGELSEALIVERSAMGQTLRPLERDGLIMLSRDLRDGRRRPVLMTPRGHETFAHAQPRWADADTKFRQYFGITLTADLQAALRAIADDKSFENRKMDERAER